ncbi:NACHT domain-containing protein [Polaromonas sp. YR568]|uniref:NACHT domain-containing protein n=1 Tax=Polaromonas sp. YR568 TaxID=1855301 RepID=UPI00398BCA4E
MTSAANAMRERLAIERRVRVRQPDGTLSAPELISHFSTVHAWVLIGNPGAGKTDAFFARSDVEGGHYISARDFVDLNLSSIQNFPLFIDGLDEIAAGTAMGSTALSQIRTKLQQLGTPKFRISCREADWRGSTDSAALQRLVGESSFLELHLEPLNQQEIRALIAHWQMPGAQSATNFIQEAEKHDLDGLLNNPQTLRMLVDATTDGWPESKTQTYQLACAKLVREHNDQWLAGMREAAQPEDQLLHAAGYLCALMLLSGNASIAPQRLGSNQKEVLALPELPTSKSTPDIAICRAALHTRLFKAAGDGQFVPAHRTVAEYLAAQYLVIRIKQGLPTNRILALMLGEDGGVVPELRGLHAWLAANATGSLRLELIDRDPLGVILYGDVRSFLPSEKKTVLDALSNEAKRYTYFRTQTWDSQSFGALATADMEEDFRRLLNSNGRSPAHLALIDCVLDAIAHGQALHGLNAELENVVRDTGYWPASRIEALRILIAFERPNGRWPISLKLLEDIHEGKVEDSEDELIGTLLLALYPSQISPTEIWSYFREPKSDTLLGSYWRFWHDFSEKNAPAADIPVLLDALISRDYQVSNQHDRLRSADIVGTLLIKGVTQQGLQMEIPHLYRWLSLGLGPHYYSPLKQEHQQALGDWLKTHPDRYKALFEFGMQLELKSEKAGRSIVWPVRRHLYSAPMPHDADLWYLSLAEKSSHEDLRRQLVVEAFRLTETNKGEDSALQLIENWRESHSADASWVDGFLRSTYPREGIDQELINLEIEHQVRAKEEEAQKLNFFEKVFTGFDAGSANLGALVEIGNAYLNLFDDSNENTAEARVLALLNGNQEWLALALQGLRQCVFRKDAPTAREIIELNVQNRRYNLSSPCLAAMELRWIENPAIALDLSEPILEMTVAFRLVNDYGNTPDWFNHLIATRPEILAHVMGPLITAQIAAKKDHVNGMYALAHDPAYAEIARIIVPTLLSNFPNKAHKNQLQSLRLLIVSLMVNLDRLSQLEVISKKLLDTAGDVAQRAYWFTAALQVAPELHLETARKYITHSQTRISHLIAMVHEQRERNGIRITLPIPALEFLIETLGPRCNPRWPNQSGWVSPAMELGRYVEGLISTLAGIHDDSARQALTTLLQQKTLNQWQDSLRRAIFDQKLTRRKALFRPASAAQVSATLSNLAPANAADLWALTLDHLQQLGKEIRDGNTNGYRQYWAGGNPRHEEECRDTLLFALKPPLSLLTVNAEPEGRYADEKRADIKVLAQNHHIPIEIKRDQHPNLWKSISNQLIARYTREAASDGYGIFLVFWFGGAGQPVAGDGGAKPKTPNELEKRLQLTVPEELQHKISVLVIDCSLKPSGKA